jgi:hypothetical protein
VCMRDKNDGEIQRWERGERENRNGTEGEEMKVREDSETIEHMRRNEREGEKGTERNMERRQQGDG